MKTILSDLDSTEAGPDGEQVIIALRGMSDVLKDGKKTDAQWEQIAMVYVPRLVDIPAVVFDAAVQKILDTKIFFPTVAEILEVASVVNVKRVMLRHRIGRLLELPTEPRVEPTPAQKAENLAILRNYQKTLGGDGDVQA